MEELNDHEEENNMKDCRLGSLYIQDRWKTGSGGDEYMPVALRGAEGWCAPGD
jgi:hypothetical protein